MQENARERREWTLSGMDCGSCAPKVRGAVERLSGVSQVDIGTMRERLSLTLDSAQTPPEQVEAAVRALGYGTGSALIPSAAKRANRRVRAAVSLSSIGQPATARLDCLRWL